MALVVYRNKPGVTIGVLLLITQFVASPVGAGPEVHPDSTNIAKDVPIADLHFHPRTRLKPSQVQKRMDRNGVRWAGAGATSKAALLAAKGKTGKSTKGGERSLWLSYSKELGDHFIAFAGQSELIHAYAEGGVDAIEDPSNSRFQQLMIEAEADLKAGRVKGIGEIFVNNRRSTKLNKFRRKSRADAPTVLQLFKLAAKYNAFLTIHMDSDDDSLEQLVVLLKSDPNGRLLWNHCGIYIEARDLRPLLKAHPNLYCEFAYRYPPVNRQKRAHVNVFDKNGPKEEWVTLIEEFPDRFMIGTDARDDETYAGSIKNIRKGLFPYLQPETLQKVAHGNAQRLFSLK
jgi:hypothetical protein